MIKRIIIGQIIIFLIAAALHSSPLTLGGILLIYGSYWLFQGNVLFSTFNYVSADLCWVTNAVNIGDIFGAVSISLGIIVGLAVMVKMNKGIFVKDLNVIKVDDDKI